MDVKKFNGTSWETTPSYVYKTATDTLSLPATIYADGTAATIGLKGNTVQNGTPTPQNPVMPNGTGERTAQLFDNANNIEAYYLDSSTGEYKSTGSTSRTALIKCTAENVYTISAYSRTFRVAFYSSKPTNGTAAITFYNYDYGSYDTHVQTVTAPQNAQYMAFFCYNSGTEAQTYTEGEIFSTVMINTGSTALPYEPYGIKIPISSANTTTPVYLGEVQTTRRIKKRVLTGLETWSVNAGTGVFYTFAISDFFATNGITCVCSHYSAQNNASGVAEVQNKCVCFRSSTYNQFYLKDTDFDSTDALKAYLAQQYAAGTPVCVWYVLKTEETATVNEPLQKIGDYADSISGISIPTTDGANALSIGTSVQPSEVTANYHGWHNGAVHERENGQWDE